MLYKNILVAHDGSEHAQEALVVAKDMIGDDSDAVMHVLSVIPVGSVNVSPDATISPLSGMSQLFPDMEAYEEMVANAKQTAISDMHESIGDMLNGVHCRVEVAAIVAVKAASGICEYAEDHSVDMIVMGRRGLGALRAMLGSVSYAVLHETSIPVVTVK